MKTSSKAGLPWSDLEAITITGESRGDELLRDHAEKCHGDRQVDPHSKAINPQASSSSSN